MGDRLAAGGVVLGTGLFGLTLTEISEIAIIFSGLAAGLASIAAAVYYIHQVRKGK